LRGPGSVSVETLSRMTGILRHRGPDESGIYVDDRVGLGHARLSIIDLAGGTQPIPNEDESLWIVFNGEIFNYPELREALVSRGTPLQNVHGHRGDPPPLRGEGHGVPGGTERAVRSRDMGFEGEGALPCEGPRGIRPLHYVVAGIGSSSPRRSNRSFRTGRYRGSSTRQGSIRSSPSGRRCREDRVRRSLRVAPGHFMQVRNGNIHIRRFWDFRFQRSEDQLDWPVGKIADTASELLFDSTRIRLRADVPVGCYLSGGSIPRSWRRWSEGISRTN